MSGKQIGDTNFFSEMSEHQIEAREFFGTVLLDSLARNFGLDNNVIFYFDTEGNFLSSVSKDGLQLNGEDHPYGSFVENDVVRHIVYNHSVRDRLTYFNVVPRLYKSTDVINSVDYKHSAYVRFLEDNFHARYSVTMAFGINAYIQVVFFKSEEEGDFTEEEMEQLGRIYIYVANSYKNFKKHEQAKIVSEIQSEIISSGENAYLITDDFRHIMSCNQNAQRYLEDILGPFVVEEIGSTSTCSWLPFLLGDTQEKVEEGMVRVRVIKDYVFKIHTFDQSYSNRIVDRYHWITISPKEEKEKKKKEVTSSNLPLTQTELKVARLMYNGLTYKAIAAELVVSYHTVKNHVQNIYSKCGVNSRYELARWMEEMSEQ